MTCYSVSSRVSRPAIPRKTHLTAKVHPLIHVTCGIEFNQPALVVEGLALTITSANRVGDYFEQAEKNAASIGQPSSKSLLELIQAIAFDEKVQAVTHYGKAIQLFNDGPVQNAPEEMVRYASQWNVGSSTVQEKAAELINAAGKSTVQLDPEYLADLFIKPLSLVLLNAHQRASS
jgi:hypothetical protein